MTRTTAAPLLLILATMIVATSSALATPPRPERQAASGRIAIHVFVTARDGFTPISEVREQDFHLTVDGRPVEGFALAPDQRPLSTVVLLDLSYSEQLNADRTWLAGKPPPKDLDAAIRSLAAVAGAGDRFRMGGIAAQPHLAPAFTTDAAGLTEQLEQLYAVPAAEGFGPSPIWDAIYAATDALDPEPGRHAVIVITDGYASGDHHFREETIEHASVSDVAVFTLLRLTTEQTGLGDAATLTGGVVLQDHVSMRGQILAALYRIVRSGYQLTFDAPVTDDRPHRVDLRTTTPNQLVVMRRYVRFSAAGLQPQPREP